MIGLKEQRASSVRGEAKRACHLYLLRINKGERVFCLAMYKLTNTSVRLSSLFGSAACDLAPGRQPRWCPRRSVPLVPHCGRSRQPRGTPSSEQAQPNSSHGHSRTSINRGARAASGSRSSALSSRSSAARGCGCLWKQGVGLGRGLGA